MATKNARNSHVVPSDNSEPLQSNNLQVEVGSSENIMEVADLKSQLLSVLAQDGILPVDPKDAIFGTDLVAKVRVKLSGEYSDNSIKNYFSAFSKDPLSPIAKISEGFGYFRRISQEATSDNLEDAEI